MKKVVPVIPEVKHLLGAMEDMVVRGDYPSLHQMIKMADAFIRQRGSEAEVSRLDVYCEKSAVGSELERIAGFRSQLDPHHPTNQEYLRLGVFNVDQVPAALVDATFGRA